MSTPRRPGDALSPDQVKLFRKEAGLSQDEFAELLGLRGGKGSVSGWETGRAPCEGPVAELILLRFGRNTEDVLAAAIREQAQSIWTRAGQPLSLWRQVVAYPQALEPFSLEKLRQAVPDAKLERPETEEDFPFLQVSGLQVAGLSHRGWVGVVPTEQQRDPQYLWIVDDQARFLYRERLWEDNAMSPFHGTVAVHALIRLALKTTTFLGRLYQMLGVQDDVNVTLSFEIEGMYDRGFARPSILARALVAHRWKESSLAALHRTTVGELRKSPLESGMTLVSKTVSTLDTDMAERSALEDLLEAMLKGDWTGPDRDLAFVRKLRN